MAYEEYDYYNEPSPVSLKESLYNILHGLTNEKNLREAGTSFKEALQLTPNVTESLGRGGVAQAIGTSGDLRDLSNTINSYLPKSVRNFTRAAEFLANPYATAIQQTAPTTEETLDFVPRATAPYEGYKQHETLGEFVAPSLGYFGGKAAKAYGNYVGPTAYKAVEDYMTKTGGILNAVEPGEAKKTQEVASAIDELGFHSPLENAILKIQQPKGTGDQFLKQLEKTPGVKTEELDVTGVKQYLLDHPTVTKQELLDYMGESRLKLENKILDETGVNDVEDYQLRGGEVYHDDDYISSMADDLHYDMKNDEVIRSQEREALLETDPERYADYETNPYAQARLEEDIDGVLYENAKQQANDMYYENPISHYYDDYDYSIYGNDEMGYTFKDPSGGFLDIGSRNGTYDLSDAEQALREYHFETGNLGSNEGAPKYEDYTLPGNYTNYREVLTTLPSQSDFDKASMNMFEFRKAVNKRLDKPTGGWDYEELTPQEQMKYDILNERMLRASKDKTNYESSHFDEPNILAHTRLNDRIINGKKTLMVEEIQSDWHQAGRRKGYATPLSEERKMEIRLALDKIRDMNSYAMNQRDAAKAEGLSTINEDMRLADLKRQEMELRSELSPKGVSDAPFKKNWHELMMKQILNEAVKGDYDAVALTTGRQQAKRYNLSEQISSVKYTEDGQLRAYDLDGREVIARKLNKPEELEDYIGKEAAKKLLDQPIETIKIPSDSGTMSNDGRQLSGIDLDVGGEPMKKFYDEIIPNFINKYGKKYGMAVKKGNLPYRGIPSADDVYGNAKKYGYSKEQFDKLPLEERMKIADEVKPKGEEVHFVELTDAAKKDIKSKGQPLFSGIGLAAPALMPEDQDKTGR
jgi:hypothetical protein